MLLKQLLFCIGLLAFSGFGTSAMAEPVTSVSKTAVFSVRESTDGDHFKPKKKKKVKNKKKKNKHCEAY